MLQNRIFPPKNVQTIFPAKKFKRPFSRHFFESILPAREVLLCQTEHLAVASGAHATALLGVLVHGEAVNLGIKNHELCI